MVGGMKGALFCGFLLLSFSVPALAQEQHGLSVFGELKYKKNFKHFAYVNPRAPKGGVLANTGAPIKIPNASPLIFNSLNGYILKGNGAQGLDLIFDSLMVRALDEPSAVYGLVARSIVLKKNGAVFNLRSRARFHNGEPLTAADVVFSLALLKAKGHPLISAQLKSMKQAKALSSNRVLVEILPKIKSKTQRAQILIFIAQLPIFSKSFYTKNDFSKTTLMPPLGSGPYRVGKYKTGSFVSYKRQKNYWAKELPVNKGRWNFDTLRFEYFRERNSEFEAFKAGTYNLREEYTSKVWVKQYNFPAIQQGKVKKLILPDKTPSGAQGWFINMRRNKFKDIRVRKALNYAFDFEWTNRNQFHGLYKRTESFFENSLLKAQGKPRKTELALLAPYRQDLPKEALEIREPLRPPRSNGSGQDRGNLRKAAALLEDAGWKVIQGARQKNGTTLTIEFMTDAPSFERIIQPFIKNLKLLGIDATLRIVDAAQYQQRLRNFDFDMTTRRFSISNTPGIELRGYLTSAFAKTAGGLNLSGISNRAIDGLVEKVITAKTRTQQRTTAHALDRALRALYVWVPQWFNDKHHIAYWEKLGRPRLKPLYGRGILDCWWAEE